MTSSLDIPLGRVIRIPCKFIKGKSEAPLLQIKAISKVLKEKGKNVLPVFVRTKGEDKYEAISNIQVLEAAKQAKLDFVWCIALDSEMETQISIESGNVVKINILSAPEAEIEEFFRYLKKQEAAFKQIDPQKATKAIVDYRKQKTPKSLNFLTTQRCGIGKAKIKPLTKFLVLA